MFNEVIDIIHEAQRKVLCHAPWSDVGCVHSSTRDSFVKFHHLEVEGVRKRKRKEGREGGREGGRGKEGGREKRGRWREGEREREGGGKEGEGGRGERGQGREGGKRAREGGRGREGEEEEGGRGKEGERGRRGREEEEGGRGRGRGKREGGEEGGRGEGGGRGREGEEGGRGKRERVGGRESEEGQREGGREKGREWRREEGKKRNEVNLREREEMVSHSCLKTHTPNLFSLLKPPQERCRRPHIHNMTRDGQNMIQQSSNLGKHGPNVLCPEGDIDPQQLLDSEGVRLLVAHHGDVVQSVHIRKRLHVGLVLHQFLCAPVQQADVGVAAQNSLDRQTETETDRETDRQRNRQTDRQNRVLNKPSSVYCSGTFELRTSHFVLYREVVLPQSIR